MTDLNIEKVLNYLSKEIYNNNEVENILNNPTEYPTDLIEKLSITTALKYWNGEMDYEAGDYIMNNLYSFWVTNDYYVKNYGFSDTAWDCFNAFDCGEYYREEDGSEIDPAEKYTKPYIEKILRERNLIV